MYSLTIFAGWGPCGALNSPGETELYVVGTALQLLALGFSGLLLVIANSRYVKRFNNDRSPKALYIVLNLAAVFIKAFVAYTAAVVIMDFFVGDANLGGYDGDTACDPITGDILMQAILVFSLTLFLTYRQCAEYLENRITPTA